MAVQLVLRKGTDAENDSFTGADAEVTVDVTNKTLRVHDGTTTGGFQTASVTGTQTLTNKSLASPVFTGQITGDLIPSADVTYDLGSATNRWNDLFLSGNTIDIGGATISVVGGSFEFKDSGGNDAEVSLAANNTDDLSEGSSNLYYTDARVRNAVSSAGDLTYNSSTGEFSVTTYKSTDFDTDFFGKSTDDLSEGTTNLYYLDTRVDTHLSGGTGVDYNTGTISIGQSVGTTDNVTFNDVVVDGDLVVNGTTTTLNTSTLEVEDINITVASGAVDSSSADGAGFTVDGANATLTYSNASDRFVFNKDIEATTLVGQVSDISNHDTDDLSEGSSNLYYTDTRVRNAVSASGDLTYNSSTGTFSFTERTDAEVRGLLSAAGDLNYNSTTGEFSVTTYKTSDFDTDFSNKDTGDLTEGSNLYYTDARVDAHLNGGSGIDFSSGTISHSDTSSVSNVSATSNTFIDAITFDTFGHVTAVSTSTAAPPNDATITVSAGTGLNGGGNFTTDQSGNETISLDVDTSTIATRSYVDTEVANLVDSSPSTLDTLNELATALGDDPNFATTVSNDIGTKANKTIDINAGSGLTGGGDLSANRTISHADTSSQGSVNNSGSTFIQDITLDGFGHITNINSSTVSGFAQENTAVTFTTVTANDFNSTSDIRKKKNIQTLDSALDKTLSLRGVSFTHNDTDTNSIGVIAQEIEEVIPEVVSTDSDGIKSVSYGNIVGLLIEAIKEQQNEIDELKAKVYK